MSHHGSASGHHCNQQRGTPRDRSWRPAGMHTYQPCRRTPAICESDTGWDVRTLAHLNTCVAESVSTSQHSLDGTLHADGALVVLAVSIITMRRVFALVVVVCGSQPPRTEPELVRAQLVASRDLGLWQLTSKRHWPQSPHRADHRAAPRVGKTGAPSIHDATEGAHPSATGAHTRVLWTSKSGDENSGGWHLPRGRTLESPQCCHRSIATLVVHSSKQQRASDQAADTVMRTPEHDEQQHKVIDAPWETSRLRRHAHSTSIHDVIEQD